MAIDQKYIALINAEIDGEISVEDRALLDAYAAGNAEAARLREALGGLCSELDALDALTPPPELKAGVLRQLPARERATATARRGIAEAFAGLFGAPALRYAMCFAAGVILTVTLISSDQAARQAFDDVTGLVGTISDAPMSAGIAAEDELRLTMNELAGSVSLNTSGSLMILDFDLASRDPVEIVATFNHRDIWFNGFAQLESQGTSVAAETGQVTVRMAGQRRYAVFLHNAGRDAATVTLRFISAGQVLHEGELSLMDNK